jgi:hypothetical protein
MGTSYFDTLFAAAADPVLDAVFAESLIYRAAGQVITFTGTLSAPANELLENREIAEAWFGETVELDPAQLVIGGSTILPVAGHEIGKVWPDGGTDIYIVRVGPKNRPYAWLDANEQRMIIFCEFIRTES